MSSITLDRDASSKLAKVHSPVVVLGDSGQYLGQFLPGGTPPDPLVMEPLLSEEEQVKRETRTTGRSLREIMADLEKQA